MLFLVMPANPSDESYLHAMALLEVACAAPADGDARLQAEYAVRSYADECGSSYDQMRIHLERQHERLCGNPAAHMPVHS